MEHSHAQQIASLYEGYCLRTQLCEGYCLRTGEMRLLAAV
jgi:hypothetical protein